MSLESAHGLVLPKYISRILHEHFCGEKSNRRLTQVAGPPGSTAGIAQRNKKVSFKRG